MSGSILLPCGDQSLLGSVLSLCGDYIMVVSESVSVEVAVAVTKCPRKTESRGYFDL